MTDLKRIWEFGRDEAEMFLDWYPDGAPREVLDVLCLGAGIASNDIDEVLARVKRNRERRLAKSRA